MRTCPRCSLANPDSAIVCDCGQVLDAEAAKSVPADAIRPPQPPGRQERPAGLGTKIFVGLVGYVLGGMFFGFVRIVLMPAVALPFAMVVPTGIVGAFIAVTLLGRVEGNTVIRRAEEGRRRSYLSRHWRGELSLGVSYWINGWLFSIVGFCIASGIAGVARSETPLVRFILILAVWILAAVGEIWYFVGTWRSADRPTSGGWISSWSGPAKVGLVIGATASVAMAVSRGWPELRAALQEARAATSATTTTAASRGPSPPTDKELEAMLDGVAILRAIKATNPAAHDEIAGEVRARMARGESRAEIERNVRAILMPIFTKALPDASDEALRRTAEVLMKEMIALERDAPELCRRLPIEQTDDAVAHLSRELLKEESEVNARVIASAGAGRPTVGAIRARVLFDRAVRHARAGGTPGPDATSACRNAAALHAAILALPHQDGADLLRAMVRHPNDFEQWARPLPRPPRRPAPPPSPELLPPPGGYRLRLGSAPLQQP